MRRLETPPYQFALRDEAHLRGLFERAVREHANGSDEPYVSDLREGVCNLVRRAKSEGHQVETVIIALKDIFGIARRPTRTFWGDEEAPPSVVLAQRVVRWCIHEYYGQAAEVPLTDR